MGCWFSCTDGCGLRALLLNATRILNKLPAAKKPYSILCIIRIEIKRAFT